MRARLLIGSIVLSLVAPVAGAAATPPPGCARGTLAQAAQQLRPDAEIASISTVAGFNSAVVLEPTVMPGIRYRLIEAGGFWCDAHDGFNAAWGLAGRPRDVRAMAETFVQLAPAPWFDDVRVRSSTVVGDTVMLRTHARTNGIVARWSIVTDRDGIARATWTAERFAVPPFDARIGGLTALPGASRSFVRAPDGSLELDGPLVPLSQPGLEALTAQYVATDGFQLVVRFYNTRFSPVLTEDIGVEPVDFVRMVRRVSAENYEEFLSWGLEKGWNPPDFGEVHIDDAISLYCLACVVVSQTFNIHMSSRVVLLLDALGYRYPDHDDAFSTVMGHEMFHNFQLAYFKPATGRRFSNGIVEGWARMQEVLHHYSAVSHQPRSLIAASDVNGCNGYRVVEAGPGTYSYSSCYFWLSYWATRGPAGLVDFLKAWHDHANVTGWPQIKATIEQATGAPVVSTLRTFAATMLSGRGLSLTAGDGTGPALDWFEVVGQWRPSPQTESEVVERWMSGGGVTGVSLPLGATVTVTPEADVSYYAVTDDGATTTVTPVTSAVVIDPPSTGERAWIIAAYSGTGNGRAEFDITI